MKTIRNWSVWTIEEILPLREWPSERAGRRWSTENRVKPEEEEGHCETEKEERRDWESDKEECERLRLRERKRNMRDWDWESKQWGQNSENQWLRKSNFEKTLLNEKEKQYEKLSWNWEYILYKFSKV